jgi:hypothetical protein
MPFDLQALAAFAFWALALPGNPGETLDPKAALARAERHDRGGWVYLHIEGPPEARGFQHGYLLSREIGEALRVRKELWRHQTGLEWSYLVKRSAEVFLPRVDPENLSEIDGIVSGLHAAGVVSTREEIVAYNAWFDAGDWWPVEKGRLSAAPGSPAKQSCSAFIATGSLTSSGQIVLGHNTWFGYPEADANVILDVQPEKGNRILMQTFPGWIHSGTDFFVTSGGIVGAETTLSNFHSFDEKGIPEFVRMRRATQDASSIEEWCSIMKAGNNGGYANAWLLGDLKVNTIARLELGLKYVGFEKTSDGVFYGSNIAEDLRILRLETTSNDVDIRRSPVARRLRWRMLVKEYSGTIDAARAKTFLGDDYDVYLNKHGPSSRSLCGRGDLDPGDPGGEVPFSPGGAFDAKVVDASMAKEMRFLAHWGAACGPPFDAAAFLAAHPQFEWMSGLLKSRPAEPWVEFRAGEKASQRP